MYGSIGCYVAEYAAEVCRDICVKEGVGADGSDSRDRRGGMRMKWQNCRRGATSPQHFAAAKACRHGITKPGGTVLFSPLQFKYRSPPARAGHRARECCAVRVIQQRAQRRVV